MLLSNEVVGCLNFLHAVVIPNDGECSAFIQEFRNWETAWALEALYVVAYEIRILAERVRNP